MQGNPQDTTNPQPSTPSQTILNSPPALTVEAIAAELKKDGMSADSLHRLAIANNPKIFDPQVVSNQAAAAIQTPAPAVETPLPPTPKQEAPKIEPQFFDEKKEVPEAPLQDSVQVSAEQEEEVSDPSAENFKKLRETFKETKKAKKELEAKAREYEEKLKTYVPPEVLQEKEAKIQELSRWEKLHNLKSSKEYQEKYIKPLNAETQKFKDLLKDYGVPEDSLDSVAKRAVLFNNRAELNNFLADTFGDQLGASEARGLIDNIRRHEGEARAAEQEPQKVLETLQESQAKLSQQREAARREQIVNTARSAWEETMAAIIKEGEVKELIPRADDPEFNETFAFKLQKQAAAEYGKVITEMAKEGTTPTKELAKALAKMTALSQVAGVSIVTRNRAMERADEVTRNAERDAGLYRPNVGGGVASRAPADQGPSQPLDPEKSLMSEIRNVTNTVLSKR